MTKHYLTIFLCLINISPSFGYGPLGDRDQAMSSMNSNLVLYVEKKDINIEAFVLNCYFENVGDEDINLLFVPFPAIKILIKSNSKEETLRQRLIPTLDISKEQVYKIGKHDKRSFSLVIRKRYYVWPKPGIYESRVIYNNKSKELDGIKLWTGQVESNTFQVEFR